MIRHQRKKGFSLLEVMVAVMLLAIGLLACTGLIVTGMASNTRNQNDSGGTLLSQMVIEQINSLSANPAGPAATLTMTDCGGTGWTVKTAGASQSSGGAGAGLESTFGGIDWLETKTGIPSGYQMDYVMCGSQLARQATYDVRWNITTMPGSGATKMITVSARQEATADGNRIIYSPPVTLRTIQGQ